MDWIVRKAWRSTVVAALLLGLAGPAQAADREPEGIGAPLEQCLACHRPGNPATAVPLIAGQNEGYLRNQLRSFRERHREGFPMPAFTVDLDDTALDDYARRIAALPWAPHGNPVGSEQALSAGAEAAERHDCGSCHGSTFLGADEIPRLAGQNRAYLARQLRDFAREGRHHPPVGTGARMYHLDEGEVAALATWLASLRPGIEAAPEP
jgi:cytochrome c553